MWFLPLGIKRLHAGFKTKGGEAQKNAKSFSVFLLRVSCGVTPFISLENGGLCPSKNTPCQGAAPFDCSRRDPAGLDGVKMPDVFQISYLVYLG